MMWIDLAELDRVFAGRWLWSTRRPALGRFKRSDYLAPRDVPLDAAVRSLVESRTGERPAGRICVLTHLRYFGLCFNPVTFYYCFDQDDRLATIVAEITNTPWGERHAYVLRVGDAERDGHAYVWRLRKGFHVSPFLPMDMDYEWRFDAPGDTLHVHMVNHRDAAAVFDATLALERRPLDGRTLARTLLRFPAMTFTVVVGIYWHALRLWLKRTPFFAHPERS
jgi:hypothetical protein